MIYHQPRNSQGNYNYNAYTYTNHQFTPHFHKNAELMVALQGSFAASVNGKSFTVRAGQMVMVLPNQIHALQVRPSSKIWVVVFSQEYVPLFMQQLRGMQGNTPVFTPSSEIFSLVLEKMIQKQPNLLMKKACLYGVCDNFLSSVTLEPRREQSDFLIGPLLDWISQHYTEDITLKQAAQVFGYEYHYLSRLLSQNYGISFSQLLADYRLEHAMELLRTTALPISEILLCSGFQSIRNFNRLFKLRTGMSPNAYRQIDKPIDMG